MYNHESRIATEGNRESHFVYRFGWFKCVFNAFLNAFNVVFFTFTCFLIVILKDIALWLRKGSL